MKAAHHPVQRPRDAKLLVVDALGAIAHAERSRLTDFLRPGDLLVANDAATLPASLTGIHVPTAAPIEVRLAGRASLAADDVHAFAAFAFGAGDHRTRTEDRAAPPPLQVGDQLRFGPLTARVTALLGHPRFIALDFEGDADAVWAGIAEHGRPIQYAHVEEHLALWDVWTRVASRPVAFEPPSAGFLLDWQLLHRLRLHGVGFATLTHAAGISSTGDAVLDAQLPLAEAYELPAATIAAIADAKARGGRVIALGTTVTRALEAAAASGLPAGSGIASQRIGPDTRLRIVDAIISGTHEPGTSHRELLRVFATDAALTRADRELETHGYRTHEFGDSVLIERRYEVAGRGVRAPSGTAAMSTPRHSEPARISPAITTATMPATSASA